MMEAYVVYRIGRNYYYMLIESDWDLKAEAENLMVHIENGDMAIICGDLDDAAELFQIEKSVIKEV